MTTKRISNHFIIPIICGLAVYTFYLGFHVSPGGKIVIPPGMERGPDDFMPLEIGPMVQYWKERAQHYGWWAFGISAFLSAAIYLLTFRKRGVVHE